MDYYEAQDVANGFFPLLYHKGGEQLKQYIEYCRALKQSEAPRDDVANKQLADLELYERAEKGDFDGWLERIEFKLAFIHYTVSYRRCDLIEKYAPRLEDHGAWNFHVATEYHPSLYPILHLVMPRDVRAYVAKEYVRHGLHREVAVHILGRNDSSTGETLTLASLASQAIRSCDNARVFLNLEELGLDLDNPELLYSAMSRCPRNSVAVALLRERCEKAGVLDLVMPNGKTLREMLREMLIPWQV